MGSPFGSSAQPVVVFPIPPLARRALAEGVRRDDAVAELEYLGLSVRTINLLENSRFGITKLEELLNLQRDELLTIPNFGASGLTEVMDCLGRYHELDTARRRVERGAGAKLSIPPVVTGAAAAEDAAVEQG